MCLEKRYEWCWNAFGKYLIEWKYSNDYIFAAKQINRSEVFKKIILCSEGVWTL